MPVSYRPLGMIAEMIEQMDLKVTHAWEDLVFISHNAFLLKMGDRGELVYLYFNQESDPGRRDEIADQLTALAADRGLQVFNSGAYLMKPRDDEQIDIHFHESS